MTKYIYYIFFLLFSSLGAGAQISHPNIIVLGITQDGGYPHMGCARLCCEKAWKNPALKEYVVSLALIDPNNRQWWLFEATPDIKEQLQYFKKITNGKYNYLPSGIFITHAHIGHYSGLMQLGREVMNTKNIPVYTLPKMKIFLETNGPWSQLVKLNNINLGPLMADSVMKISDSITITAFIVPHRDEYSETAGFRISTGSKKYLFIPDINKWDKWDRNIIKEVDSVDIAFLDATFYDANELSTRNMNEIMHPFVTESLSLFTHETKSFKSKIYFIHLNHTNPLLWDHQKQSEFKKAGFKLAKQGLVL